MKLPTPSILETALHVEDLDLSERFYGRLFDLETRLADESMRALAMAGGQLLLFRRDSMKNGNPTPRGFIPGHDGSGRLHIAFAIGDETVDAWRQRLAEMNVEIISHVRPEQGGESLYFRDPDGHLIELATPKIWDL